MDVGEVFNKFLADTKTSHNLGAFLAVIFLAFMMENTWFGLLPALAETTSSLPFFGEAFHNLLQETLAARIRFWILLSVSAAVGGWLLKSLTIVLSFLPLVIGEAVSFGWLPYWSQGFVSLFLGDIYKDLFIFNATIIGFQLTYNQDWHKDDIPKWIPFIVSGAMIFIWPLIWPFISVLTGIIR